MINKWVLVRSRLSGTLKLRLRDGNFRGRDNLEDVQPEFERWCRQSSSVCVVPNVLVCE